MDLAFANHTIDDRLVLVVSGEIDLATAPQLRARLVEEAHAAQSGMIIDLSAVAFIDSTGLGVLVGARRRAQQVGSDVVLVVPQPDLRKLFAVTGLERIFTIVDALGSDQGAQR